MLYYLDDLSFYWVLAQLTQASFCRQVLNAFQRRRGSMSSSYVSGTLEGAIGYGLFSDRYKD